MLDCLICVTEKKVTNADGDVGEEEGTLLLTDVETGIIEGRGFSKTKITITMRLC